jgi:Tfp pilus assembly protein PilP
VENRTKKLVILLGILAVIAVGFYCYKYFLVEKPAPPKIVVKMGAQVAKKANPAPVTPAAAAPEKRATTINVMEKGKEIKYSSPEEFVAKTTLTPLEAEDFSKKKLEEAKKRFESARAGRDKAAIVAAEDEMNISEKLNSLVAAHMRESMGRKTYAYAALGKRDPFMNPFEIPKVYPPIPPNAKPFETVPIEQISLKAVVWNQKGYRAMVVTPDGRSFTVKAGDRIGDKLGVITKVTSDRIYVTEKIKDILGDVETKKTIMQLHHKEAE